MNKMNEPMLDMFLYETTQLMEQLETCILTCEKEGSFSPEALNEIFRIMHTTKGSSAMMMFENISTITHSMEDIFYFIREEKPVEIKFSILSDLVLETVDFIKVELEKIRSSDPADGDSDALTGTIKEFLCDLKQKSSKTNYSEANNSELNKEQQKYYISQDKSKLISNLKTYKAVIFFEEGCEMENIRAYTIVHNLKDSSQELYYIPKDIIDSDESAQLIRNNGFTIYLKSELTYMQLNELLEKTIFLKSLELQEITSEDEFNQDISAVVDKDSDITVRVPVLNEEVEKGLGQREVSSGNGHQSIISVSVAKLDKLMDLVGEMVIAEAMVIQNPDLIGLELDNFQKASRQLNKITSELQDMVMSIRMVPLSATFHKMHRIMRDMSKKLSKEVELIIYGEETEVDKNIIERISDPLMHLVRNAIDHGIESKQERVSLGKPEAGSIILEAKNSGSDVLINIKDDGKGLSKEKILEKAEQNGLLYKSMEEMTDKEIFNLILLPGFSTKDKVTEFSGRGVGMDVVVKNIESVGGTVSVESSQGHGTTITLKIPLTLAIIDGMNIRVGESRYTIPTISIKESFRPLERDLITDPDGNEMIMVRGQCYKILRLHKLHGIETKITQLTEGIIIMVHQEDKTLCIFADELVGQQQVVVKALPKYIQSYKKIKGLAGCTLLGDGSISLIVDVIGLINL